MEVVWEAFGGEGGGGFVGAGQGCVFFSETGEFASGDAEGCEY